MWETPQNMKLSSGSSMELTNLHILQRLSDPSFCRVAVTQSSSWQSWEFSFFEEGLQWMGCSNKSRFTLSLQFIMRGMTKNLLGVCGPLKRTMSFTWSYLFTGSLYCPLPELTSGILRDFYESEFAFLLHFCKIRSEILEIRRH